MREINFPESDGSGLPMARSTFGDFGDTLDQSLILNIPYELSVFRVEDDKITVRDAIWGDEFFGDEPGDEVFLHLAGHPAISRLQGIEQLTLPRFMSVIPGTTGFSRWEHAWGSAVLARKLMKDMDLPDEVKRKKELRAFLSDVPQWAFSHLGDWMFQGLGGTEDDHDQGQREFLRKTGVVEVLEQYGYDVDELLVHAPSDSWEECPAPGLNLDKLDYAAREIFRWMNASQDFGQRFKQFPFEVDGQGRLIITDVKFARQFTKAYMLLSTEHWQEPVHRLQLILLQEGIRHGITHYEPSGMQPIVGWRPYHPRDMLSSVDFDFEIGFKTSSPMLWAIHDVASRIGYEKRNIFRMMRQETVHEFVRDTYPRDLPDPLVAEYWHAKSHSLLPANVEIIPVESTDNVPDFQKNPYSVDLELPPLKLRQLDPHVRTPDGQVRKLSETEGNEDIADLLRQHKEILARTYVARVLLNKEFKKVIDDNMVKNKEMWDKHLEYPRMKDEDFRKGIEHIAGLAVAMRKVHIEWYR